MSAALTPRGRTLIVCDGVRASKSEENVFHLRGARTHIQSSEFPVWRRLSLFLILSSLRAGRFPSYVKVIDDETEQAVFYGQVDPPPMFAGAAELLPFDLPIRVRFPKAGRYTLPVWFFNPSAADVLKMEHPLYVLGGET